MSNLGLQDWEAWFPLWEVNLADPRLWVYANMSRELVRKAQPTLDPAMVEAEAKAAWDAAVQRLFLQTLGVAQEMRPRASWGWYDYPACSWGRGKDMCSGDDGLAMNAELDWLWKSVDSFHPSIYLCSLRACTALSGPIFTILTVLSWICVGIHRCEAMPSPVCA